MYTLKHFSRRKKNYVGDPVVYLFSPIDMLTRHPYSIRFVMAINKCLTNCIQRMVAYMFTECVQNLKGTLSAFKMLTEKP